MNDKNVIESFTLDHTKVLAPYVRLIEITSGPKGDVISNFDIRLAQPNQEEIPTAAMHTLEHLLALYLRQQLDGYIDCSPYGCRTGFHLILWNEHSASEVGAALKSALESVCQTQWDEVPGIAEKECGNYRDHSLFSAREWAKKILAKGISEDAFVRKIV